MVYSYSKLKTFASCPLQFRYRYLDRIPTELESIEAFTGKRVHEVLEALYRGLEVDAGSPPALEELLGRFDTAWRRAWHAAVEVVKEAYTAADYHRLGSRCLTTFYRGNWPFAGDRTLALESEIEFDLAGPGSPRLRGIIDRVASGEQGALVIHDYKTSTYLPRQDEILADLQLAIYQLGAAERWPGAAEVKLVWHFLAFGRRVTVGLGGPGLAEKRAEIGRRIAAIERAVEAGDLPARVSALCRWCAYRDRCPAQGGARRDRGAPVARAAPEPVALPRSGAPPDPIALPAPAAPTDRAPVPTLDGQQFKLL